MKTLRFGLIGCGALGKAHAACVAKLPQAKFVAYADASEETAQACLKEFGGEYAVDDANKVFADKSIDAVYICTWHDSHASLAIAAAKAKKHILIEKPLALKMDQCLQIAEIGGAHV
jgi:predicted dehydrogenase